MITVVIQTQSDIVEARRRGRDLAMQLGLSAVDQTRLATAISELTRNALQYAGGGVCEIEDRSDALHIRIELRVSDTGPGIADVNAALLDGYSTGGGLGAGLPGTRRLMSHFALHSQPGQTRIEASLVRHRALVRPAFQSPRHE